MQPNDKVTLKDGTTCVIMRNYEDTQGNLHYLIITKGQRLKWVSDEDIEAV